MQNTVNLVGSGKGIRIGHISQNDRFGGSYILSNFRFQKCFTLMSIFAFESTLRVPDGCFCIFFLKRKKTGQVLHLRGLLQALLGTISDITSRSSAHKMQLSSSNILCKESLKITQVVFFSICVCWSFYEDFPL